MDLLDPLEVEHGVGVGVVGEEVPEHGAAGAEDDLVGLDPVAVLAHQRHVRQHIVPQQVTEGLQQLGAVGVRGEHKTPHCSGVL